MPVLISIPVCELQGDFHPPFLLFLYLDVDNKLSTEATHVKSQVVGDDMVDCVVFPDGFLAVRAVDWDVGTQ